MTSHGTRVAVLAHLSLLGGLLSCAGSSTSSTSSTSAALSTAQCTYQSTCAAADACIATFKSCVASEAADAGTCQAALEACMPVPPQGADGGVPMGGHGDHGGGRGGHGGPGGGGCMDGGQGPGQRPDGGEGRGGGERAEPDSAAVTACHTALDTCLAATPGDATCFETERACEKAAFQAAFTALCATASSCDATTDTECAELQQRCAEGVDGRPGAFDGGTCQ